MDAYKRKMDVEDAMFALSLLKEYGFTEVFVPNFLEFLKEIAAKPTERRISPWLETLVKYFRPMSMQEMVLETFQMDHMPEGTKLDTWKAVDKPIEKEEEE